MAEIKINHKNWLGSEENRVLKTATLNSTNVITTQNEVDPSGNTHTIAVSGSVFADSATGIYGLVYEDVDITRGGQIGSIMVGGYYIADKLPTAVSTENEAKFKAQGLFAIIESDAVRPEWAKVTD